MAKGYVIRELAEQLVIALVLIALVFDYVLHNFESWAVHKIPHVQTIMRNLYREVMIMGLVSFGFILYTITGERDKDTLLTFEVAHILLFLMSVFNIMVVMFAVGLSLLLSNHWKKFERMKINEFKDHKKRYHELNRDRRKHDNKLWRAVGWCFLTPWRYFQFRYAHEVIVFHDLRWQFIHFRNLADTFKFASFLRRVKSLTFIDLVDSHPGIWITLLAFVGADLARGAMINNKVVSWNPANFDSFALITLSGLCTIFVTILSGKIRKIYMTLTANPSNYYERIPLPAEDEETRAHAPNDITYDPSSEMNVTDLPALSFPVVHQPIYSTMSYAPERQVIPSEVLARHSLDLEKAKKVSALLGSGGPARECDENPTETSETRGGKFDVSSENPADESNEIEIDRVVPLEPMNSRTLAGREVENDGPAATQQPSAEARAHPRPSLNGNEYVNVTLAQTAQDLQEAREAELKYKFPKCIVYFFPRLGRVPSKAERLFWIGSKTMFLRFLEGALFFTNVNLSATIAKLMFHLKGHRPGVAKEALKGTAVHAAAVPKVVVNAEESSTILFVTLGISIFTSLYVLFRSARIMRTYIFVLTNANLIDENVAVQMIHSVKFKNMLDGDPSEQNAKDDSDSDGDNEEENVANRRALSEYMQTVNSGNHNHDEIEQEEYNVRTL